MALAVISLVLTASTSSGEGSGSSWVVTCPDNSPVLGPPGPPFVAEVFPLPMPLGIWPACCATMAVTLTRIGLSKTITSDCKWGKDCFC
jgi:hypothetical protein